LQFAKKVAKAPQACSAMAGSSWKLAGAAGLVHCVLVLGAAHGQTPQGDQGVLLHNGTLPEAHHGVADLANGPGRRGPVFVLRVAVHEAKEGQASTPLHDLAAEMSLHGLADNFDGTELHRLLPESVAAALAEPMDHVAALRLQGWKARVPRHC